MNELAMQYPALVWGSIGALNGFGLGWLFASFFFSKKYEQFDNEEEFVIEWAVKLNSGSELVKKPYSEWPSWADDINPMRKH